MQTIYVPTFAAKKADVETMFQLLEEEVGKKYFGKLDFGLEIGGMPQHFTDQETLETIVDNMKSVAGGTKSVVHGFAGLAVYTEGISDMSKQVGKDLLDTYIGIGKKLGSSYVHVHGSAGFQGIKEPDDKSEILARIRENLLYGLNHSGGIPIGIENLPTPSACDFDSNPDTVWSDCVQQPEDCMEIVRGTKLKFTFDTAHYGINRNGYIDLTEPVKMMKDHLYHLHVVDATGYWEPNVSGAYDGIVPGDGRVGKDSFAHFFKHIAENHPNLGICIEVHNKSYDDPAESREGIRRVINWLNV